MKISYKKKGKKITRSSSLSLYIRENNS